MSHILIGADRPMIYLTSGVHADGEWKRMWYVCDADEYSRHFSNWNDALDYANFVAAVRLSAHRRSEHTANQSQHALILGKDD